MANKPKSPAQVAAARKVAVEQQKVNAQKNAANKAKVAANKSKVSANASKVQSNAAKMKTVTGSAVKVTAPKPGMKTVTSKDVTVTAKRKPEPVAMKNKVYLVKKGGQNVEVSLAEYNATKGPKDYVYLNESGQPLRKGSGGAVNTELKYNSMTKGKTKKKM